MATPSLAMIPSAYADSKVYSVLPNNGDGDFTFNRDSSATRVGQNGLIQEVGFFGNDLVVNGDFVTDTNWSKNAGITISGGSVNFTGLAGQYASQDISFVSGKVYKINFNVLSGSGTLTVFLGAGNNVSPGSFSIGKNKIIATGGGADTKIYFGSTFTGSITNISVQEVTGDQPRLNYDISNGVVQSCPSLLLEPASTNIVPYSENFSQWTLSGATVVNNNAISPDGTLNASKITATNTDPTVIKSLNVTASTYNFSFYVKGEGNSIGKEARILFWFVGSATGTTLSVPFNLTNDWVRISSPITVTGAGTLFFRIDFPANLSEIGDIGYIWGAQVEEQSYATSYIPTNGSSQTRAAESCNDAGNAATFNSTEGVLYAEISALSDDGTARTISINNTVSNRVFLQLRSATGQVNSGVVVGGALQGNAMSYSVSQTSNIKLAIKYKANDFALWVNGVEVGTSIGNVFSSGTLNDLSFDSGDGSEDFYGNTKDIRVYNEALTDAQLQTLTTL